MGSSLFYLESFNLAFGCFNLAFQRLDHSLSIGKVRLLRGQIRFVGGNCSLLVRDKRIMQSLLCKPSTHSHTL